VEAPVATIGVAEKGFLTLSLAATASPAHSSMPPATSAVKTLVAALDRLHTAAAPAFTHRPPTSDMLAAIAPHSAWPHRLALANPWLLGAATTAALTAAPNTAALVTTTTATTVIRAGYKDNVVPGLAEATVNHRLAPGDTVEAVLARDRQAIADPSVEVTLSSKREPSPPSFTLLSTAASLVFPAAVPVPTTMIANTDSYWYLPLSPNVYRFLPLLLRAKDLPLIHGHDEAVSLENIRAAARFYRAVIVYASSGSLTE